MFHPRLQVAGASRQIRDQLLGFVRSKLHRGRVNLRLLQAALKLGAALCTGALSFREALMHLLTALV